MSAARTIPLAEIAITLPVHNDWVSDPEGETITIAGRQLAIMLSWLERTGKLRGAATEPRWSVSEVEWDLQALRDLLLSLSVADMSGNSIDTPPLFRLLSHCAGDLAARLGAIDNEEKILEAATVTIGAPEAK
jgi:hypothetical protein